MAATSGSEPKPCRRTYNGDGSADKREGDGRVSMRWEAESGRSVGWHSSGASEWDGVERVVEPAFAESGPVSFDDAWEPNPLQAAQGPSRGSLLRRPPSHAL
jgi:hypothetical protein